MAKASSYKRLDSRASEKSSSRISIQPRSIGDSESETIAQSPVSSNKHWQPGLYLTRRHRIFNRIADKFVHCYNSYVVPNMGVTLTLISQFFNSLMILFCKLLLMDPDFDEPMHPFQILFVRMSITYVCCAIYLIIKHDADFPFGPKGYRKYMIGRGIGGYIAVAGQYFALLYLTMSDTISITFLAPVITSLMAYMFLHERFTKAEAIGGMIAFVGVIFISRPSFIFGGESTMDSTTAGTEAGATTVDQGSSGNGRNLETSDPKLRLLGSLFALSAPFGTGIAMCSIRKIGFHAHALVTVSFFALIICIFSFLGIMLTPGLNFEMPRNARQWAYLILLGLAGFIMQYLLTAGMQREKAARAIAMSYSQLVYASFFDLVIFGHWPSRMSLIGEFIIITAVISILYCKDDSSSSSSHTDTESFAMGEHSSGESISMNSLSDDDDSHDIVT